jgi:predicted dehydrogenase
MPFKICVIGCGHITQASHGPAYRRYASENREVELSACCDTDPARAEQVRAALGFARAYSDTFEMLAREQPDVVCLNVPVALTPVLCERILALGIPLLTEKPPAMTVDEIDRLIALSAQATAPHQVAFNRRFAPLVVEMKRWLAGRPVVHVEHTFTRVNRRDPDFSTTAIHGIDTLRFLLGSDYAHLRMQYPTLETGPAPVSAFILDGQFQSGASVHMLFQPLAGIASERTVVYTHGSSFDLRLNQGADHPGHLLHYENGQLARAIDGAALCASSEDYLLSGFYAEDAAFFDALRARQPSEHSFASARQSVEVMQCLRERVDEYGT